MKGLKISLVIMAAALLTIYLSDISYAFHEGGVARCEGCHTMHNSSGNKSMMGGSGVGNKPTNPQFTGVAFLLQGTDQSSTCLNCHAGSTRSSYRVLTYPMPGAGIAPVNWTPGGDFAYLGKRYEGTGHGSPFVSLGERHGHNVIAADYGLLTDTTLLTGPGGSYSSASKGTQNFGCHSCHDPHSNARIVDANGTIAYNKMGQATLPIKGSGSTGDMPTATEAVGVYRLLAGKGYVPFSYSSAPPFVNSPPVAVSPSSYNRSENTADTRVAYGQGMSEWCANCHAQIHTTTGTGTHAPFIHPAGQNALLAGVANVNGQFTTIAAVYNAYVKSGDLTGQAATSYTSMVPYEEGTNDRETLASHAVSDGTQTAGPNTGRENVMCLSCHRAHATGFDSISRWNNRGELLTIAGEWPGTDATDEEAHQGKFSTGKTKAEYQAAMYDRSATAYATFQRSLCNKCHAKD